MWGWMRFGKIFGSVVGPGESCGAGGGCDFSPHHLSAQTVTGCGFTGVDVLVDVLLLNQKPAGLKTIPQNSHSRRAPCVTGPWCLEVVLGFSLWLKFQPLSPAWPVLLASYRALDGDRGNKRHKANSERAGELWPVLCRMSEMEVSPMSQLSPLSLLESRARGDTR